ncbi:MAG: hypothetical protein JJE01_03460 [Gemmatimonadetes bacterium]|nr:hypothetical protein [Gemmatimonadota bacterium]
MKRIILITLVLAFALASCGGDGEIAQVDAEFEIQERGQIDAAITDLKALRADPGRALVARESIDRYLRAGRVAERFNKEVGIEGDDGAPIAVPPVIAEDKILDPARKEVPSLFGPSGKAIVPEDLRQFPREAADDLAAAIRPAVAGPVELLIARARRYGPDATYPDSDGLTRGELIAGAAVAVKPYWPDLAAELEGVLEDTG